MARILGIDPGSRVTGYGVIEIHGARPVHIAHGCVRAQDASFPERLRVIFERISAVVVEYRPDEMAVEQVFVQRNVDSALKLGQARGAAICGGIVHGVKVSEYSPAAIKKALVGRGGAAKEQVQHMVRSLLALDQPLLADAADALACALCHGHTRQTFIRSPALRGLRTGRGS